MPFTGGDPTLQPMSAPWNTDPVNFTSSDSITIATPGAATWPPSAASSSVTSLMDSSAAAPITEITLVSSPPTSHAASPSRTISSPLRPSSAANMPGSPLMAREMAKAAALTHAAVASVAHMDQVVAISDTEDGANTLQHSSSQARQSGSIDLSDQHTPADGSSVYVHIPITSPSSITLPQESSSTKKKTKKQGESPRRRSSAGSDSAHASPATLAADAAYAAALAAQEETLARRRPTRNARKEVSYSPMCDLEGKPLPGKKDVTASAFYSKSKAAAKEGAANKTKGKRRSRAFSDDQDEENDVGNSKSTANQVIDVNADVTDDDVGFASRRERKKVKMDSEGEGEKQTKSTKLPNKRQRAAVDDDAEEDALSEHDHKNDDDQDAILTPPAPTSPRRSSRRSLPSPKKQTANDKATKKGKGKQQKTFDLEQEAAVEDDDQDEQPRATTTQKAAKRNKSPSPEPEEESDEEAAEEEAEDAEKPSPATDAPKPASAESRPSSWSSTCTSTTTNPSAAASVAMKRINTSSPAPPSPSTCSPNARSFFGKPLTKLLNSGAVRRPGLTRKTKIPSLLNHRGAPKAPAPQLTASKRRMQDDDYEYDPDYEALVAKNKPEGSDEESDGERGVEHDDGAEGEGKIVEEYD
ncbi:uncharacterized protein UDID_02327 [Ustilago sp. UG-2017a]|nr:uncharacterized protein UDID_02327 [Ustilago sp. UG-2017a]